MMDSLFTTSQPEPCGYQIAKPDPQRTQQPLINITKQVEDLRLNREEREAAKRRAAAIKKEEEAKKETPNYVMQDTSLDVWC